MPVTEPTVLYVEDDDSDRFFMELAFRTAGMASALRMVVNGRQAIAYLDGRGPYADRKLHPLPHLILLDLRMPELSGFEVLEWIKERPELSSVPIVVLSSSCHPDDSVKAKALGAADFWQKPSNSLSYRKVLASLRNTWPDILGAESCEPQTATPSPA